MKNKIKKRLVKINTFLRSRKKPSLKINHLLRLEVKHLEALMGLMMIQNDFAARPGMPRRLEKLFHEAGELRKFGLEMGAIHQIINKNGLSKPTGFLQQLKISKKKSSRKLGKIRKAYPAIKMRDFVMHPNAKLSPHTSQQFLTARSSSILDLLSQDILSDIRSLHQLRKILKSILYVLPVWKKGDKPLWVFLKTRKKFMESVESKIGSLHDTDSFITSLEREHNIMDAPEQDVLKKIKREWQTGMMHMKEDLRPLLPAVQQFALDLKDQSKGNLYPARKMFH